MKYITLIFCVLLLASPAYCSYNPSYRHTELEQEYIDKMGGKLPACSRESDYMLGNWHCKREELANKGVVFSQTFTMDYLADVSGGRGQGARYDHSLGWDIDFDLERFAGIPDTHFHISGLWRQGQNLSKAVIGNDMVVSTIYGHEQFRFYNLYLARDFFNKRLNIKIGRIAAGDDFASSPIYSYFVSNAVDGVPISLPINLFFSVYPTATWGARAKYDLNKDFYILSAIYNGDKGVERDDMYGLDFSLRLKQGIAFAQELAYSPEKGLGPHFLPGNYKAGIYYNGAVRRELYSDINGAPSAITGLDNKKQVGSYNIYFHADQMIYREKGTEDEGLTPFVVATIGPHNLNKFPFFITAGAIYKGLVPDRPRDTTAFEVIYAQYSNDLRRSQELSGAAVQNYEMVLEFTHKVVITKWMYMQPDLQYIIQPGGTGNIDDALVIGFQFGLVF